MTLTSVWEGTDGPLLDVMLGFYPRQRPETILDATYNEGRIWAGAERRPSHTMDIAPRVPVDWVCDNQEMPGVPDAMFDVVVYDPPHVHNIGAFSSKDYGPDFGGTLKLNKATGYTLSFLYPGFLRQARRVLRRGGLVLAKITDQVSNHRSQWAHVDFIKMAEAEGFTVCDMIIKVRKGPMMSSKWQTMHHARKRHCFWVILRNGESCER